MEPKLCLGTVQFGMSYGITNKTGKVSNKEVQNILNVACREGIQYFDTAQAYGVSEIVLGSNWPFNANPKVISKIKPCSSPNDWDQNFYETLSHLKLDYLDALLVHRASDLYSTDGTRLLDWLERLRQQGRVGRIGVSIYDSSELSNLDLDRIQLVQLPLSIYDQRFLVDGTLEMLRKRGISIHVRSVFLQGLILRGSDEWPKFLSDEFVLHHSTFVQSLNSLQLSPLEFALGFVRSCHDVEAVLVGVLSSDELLEVISAWSSNVYLDPNLYPSLGWHNVSDLDPRFWAS